MRSDQRPKPESNPVANPNPNDSHAPNPAPSTRSPSDPHHDPHHDLGEGTRDPRTEFPADRTLAPPGVESPEHPDVNVKVDTGRVGIQGAMPGDMANPPDPTNRVNTDHGGNPNTDPNAPDPENLRVPNPNPAEAAARASREPARE